MKLTLKNFRCHENKVFEFDNNGLILILGSSGQGKSTILNAILFVLYGTGKKLQTFGKSSCVVEFEYKNLKITRSKTPNRLILIQNNIEYEDDVAQHIINDIFGNNFHVVSYIPQNVISSFIVKSPTEKLEFLEMFAFKDINLSVIKDKCKDEINIRKEQLNKTINELEVSLKIFKEMKEPVEVIFPLNGKGSKEKLIKNEEIRVKNSETRIKKFKIQLKKLQCELGDLLVLEAYINSKNDTLESLNLQLEQLSLEEGSNTYIGDEDLESYKKRLDNILSKKELFNLKNKYKEDLEKLENMKQYEIETHTKELNKINSNLWMEYSKEEGENTIEDFKECLKDVKEISKLKNKIANYKVLNLEELNKKKNKLDEYKLNLDTQKELLEKIKKQSTIYSCPCCKNKLNFIENKLVILEENIDIQNNLDNTDVIKEKIIYFQKEIKKLENIIPFEELELKNKNKDQNSLDELLSQYEEIPTEDDLKTDLKDLETYFEFQINQENKKSEIENMLSTEKFSSSYVSFKNDLINTEKKIKKLDQIEDIEEQLNEEDLRTLISSQERNKQSLESLNIRKDQLEKEKTKYNIKLEELRNKHIAKYTHINGIESVKNCINQLENDITEQENCRQDHIKNLNQIDKYNKYIEEKEKYLNFKNSISELETKEKEDRKKYNSSILLKDKILEAESIAISNIIHSINNHAQVYLEYFFPDNPIIVKLLSFKETKNNSKPQINIEIEYKGNECDLNSLSGGELQRVVLAFTLALSEMFNTHILMLDECTSNLDQELTNTVFEGIKENFKNKFVLIVAHQVVTGLFDKVINM